MRGKLEIIEQEEFSKLLRAFATGTPLHPVEKTLLDEVYLHVLEHPAHYLAPEGYRRLLSCVAALQYGPPALVSLLESHYSAVIQSFATNNEFSSIEYIMRNFLRIKRVGDQFIENHILRTVAQHLGSFQLQSLAQLALGLSKLQYSFPLNFWELLFTQVSLHTKDPISSSVLKKVQRNLSKQGLKLKSIES